MKKKLCSIFIFSLLTINYLVAQDFVLADFDTTDPQPMVLAKWANGNQAIWQDTNIVQTYDTVPNPATDGFNTSPYCMHVGEPANADWWGNFSGISIPNIVNSADSLNGSGILVTAEQHFLKIFVMRSANDVTGFRVCIGTTENPSNGMDYTSPGGSCPFTAEGVYTADKFGVWTDYVYDLTSIIGQHIRTVGFINSENWSNPRPTIPATDYYYDQFVLSDDPTPRDVVVPPLQTSSDGFYIGFEDTTADADWYSDITAQDPLSSYSIVDNTPDAVNLTTKVLEFDKSATAPYAQSGPLFTLNGAMPTSTNQYLHAFVKVPDSAIDPNTGYCAVQIIARNWQVGDSAKIETPVFDPDVWQDIVLPITTPIGKTAYISNFSVLFDCRLNQFGRPASSPENIFYLDGIVLNNDPDPRSVLETPVPVGDFVLADFDTTDPQPMVLAKWANGNQAIWQDTNIVQTYDTVPNPATDGFNTSPYCMHVGEPANADWWGNFSGISIPNIVNSADSMNGSGILVTPEKHFLKIFVMRSANDVTGFRVCIGTTENPSNGMDYTSPGGSCPFTAEGVYTADKFGVWTDYVYDLTSIIGQHIRTVGFINSENWSNPRPTIPATDYYYDQFVLSDNPTPRDVVVPPLQTSSDGFYIGFEDTTADAEWYSDIAAQDPLSSYSIVDNTPDAVNLTTKVLEFDKSATAPYAQSGPLFTLNGAMPTSTNQYLHAFVKVPDSAIDPNTGYCAVQIIARNWQVGDSAKIETPVFDPDVWQDIVLPITTPIGKTAYISNFSVLFDCRLNQFGRPASSPENIFYLDGIVLNNDPDPRSVLESTGIKAVAISNLIAFNSNKNTITVTPVNNSKVTVFNSMGQTIVAAQVNAGVSQQFTVSQPGIYIIEAISSTSKQIAKVLCK